MARTGPAAAAAAGRRRRGRRRREAGERGAPGLVGGPARLRPLLLLVLLVLLLPARPAAAARGLRFSGSANNNPGAARFQNALKFNGRDQYAKVVGGVPLGGQSFTIEFWARRDRLEAAANLGHGGRPQYLFAQGTRGEGRALELGFAADGRLSLSFDVDRGAGLVCTAAAAATSHRQRYQGPAPDTWHHFAATYETRKRGNLMMARLYRDGNVVRECKMRKGYAYAGPGPFFVGRGVRRAAGRGAAQRGRLTRPAAGRLQLLGRRRRRGPDLPRGRRAPAHARHLHALHRPERAGPPPQQGPAGSVLVDERLRRPRARRRGAQDRRLRHQGERTLRRGSGGAAARGTDARPSPPPPPQGHDALNVNGPAWVQGLGYQSAKISDIPKTIAQDGTFILRSNRMQSNRASKTLWEYVQRGRRRLAGALAWAAR